MKEIIIEIGADGKLEVDGKPYNCPHCGLVNLQILRKTFGIKVICVESDLGLVVRPERVAGVGVRVEARVVARRDGDPDLMAAVEHDAGGPDVDLEEVDAAGLHEHLRFHGLAVARAQDAVEHQHGAAVQSRGIFP